MGDNRSLRICGGCYDSHVPASLTLKYKYDQRIANPLTYNNGFRCVRRGVLWSW